MNQKVLITDLVHTRLLEGLQELDFEVDYRKDFAYDKLEKIIANYVGLIINSKINLTAELLEKAQNLRFIGRLGSGLEIIDLKKAYEKGIYVFNAPEGNKNAVAEHALGMLLVLTNKLFLCDKNVRQQIWDRESCRGFELEKKTIGIIGFGNNGSAFAEKLLGFNVKVLAYDKYKKQFAHLYPHVYESDLETVQMKSDIISLHVPWTTETNFMINDKFLKKCKKNVIIINTSRGKIVDTNSLINAIKSKYVGGACLDVFENEKPHSYSENERNMYSDLYQLSNIVLSPHVAGWTNESLYKISDTLLKKITNVNKIYNF